MTNAAEYTERVVRWRMAGIAMLLSTAVAVGANAQQTETGGSAGQRSTGNPCPPMQVSPSTSSTTAGANGTTTYGPSGAAATTGVTTTTPTTPSGTPTDAGTTAGVAATTTPNNTSTNPDQRFKGLNATNGAAGVGADTTTTGKHVATAVASGSLPADSAAAKSGVTAAAPCVPRTGSLSPDANMLRTSNGEVQLDDTPSERARSSRSIPMVKDRG